MYSISTVASPSAIGPPVWGLPSGFAVGQVLKIGPSQEDGRWARSLRAGMARKGWRVRAAISDTDDAWYVKRLPDAAPEATNLEPTS